MPRANNHQHHNILALGDILALQSFSKDLNKINDLSIGHFATIMYERILIFCFRESVEDPVHHPLHPGLLPVHAWEGAVGF